jgi:hypothetical protein
LLAAAAADWADWAVGWAEGRAAAAGWAECLEAVTPSPKFLLESIQEHSSRY